MTAVDHAELKRLAEGATPGEWTCKEGSTAYPECDDKDFWAVVLSPAGKEVVTLHERSSLDDRADYDFDAAFIAAANPAVVLALLSEIEGLKAERYFAQAVADVEIEDIDLEYAVVNLLYGRGAIDKKTKTDAVVAVKTLRAIIKAAKALCPQTAESGT